MATRPDPVDVMKAIDEEFRLKTNSPHSMEETQIFHIDPVEPPQNLNCTGETTLIALADHAAKNAEGAPLDIDALRQHRLAGTRLCDLADADARQVPQHLSVPEASVHVTKCVLASSQRGKCRRAQLQGSVNPTRRNCKYGGHPSPR